MTIRDQSLGNWQKPLRHGLLLVAFTFIGVGGWASFASIDAAVPANGTVVAETDRKAVQHLEGGIVSKINVVDGDRVVEGQTLIVIDSSQALANMNAVSAGLLSLLGDEARLAAIVAKTSDVRFSSELTEAGEIGVRIMADQKKLYAEALSNLSSSVAIADRKVREAKKQVDGVRGQVDAANEQVASLSADIERIRPVVEKGYISLSRLTTEERELSDLNGRRVAFESDLVRFGHVVEAAEIERDQIVGKFIEDASAKLADVRSKIVDLREKKSAAVDVMGRMEVKASRTGRIVNSKVHAIGAVARPGETLMEIVPESDRLVLSVRVSPLDVTHVAPGQIAEVRFSSFKARTTPTIFGEVSMLAADVSYEETSRQPYYEMRVVVSSSMLSSDIKDLLRPGLPAEVLVKTGERTVMSYLVQPLFDAMRTGMREI